MSVAMSNDSLTNAASSFATGVIDELRIFGGHYLPEPLEAARLISFALSLLAEQPGDERDTAGHMAITFEMIAGEIAYRQERGDES